ncbi:hypothetical protein [Sphingomonas daechungensis]|uniref:hypothetical protein n=1 Tax=Sphingomonas daechungensis TaxID=1176646 RepID=UPI0037832D74
MATQLAGASKVKTNSSPDIQVRVKAFKDATGTVQFDYDWNFAGGPTKTGKIDVAEGTPPTDIKFHFRDETNLGLKFYPAPADAFWVDFDPNCPTAAGDAGEFDLKSPPSSSSNNLLTVRDLNKSACNLKYALRFDGKPYDDANGHHPPFIYDPDLKNGGNTRSVTSFSSTALVGVATIAIVAVIAIVWLAR